jgi:hypothetical protein
MRGLIIRTWNLLFQLMANGAPGEGGAPAQRHVVAESNPDPDLVVILLLNMAVLIVQGFLPIREPVTLKTVQVSQAIPQLPYLSRFLKPVR